MVLAKSDGSSDSSCYSVLIIRCSLHRLHLLTSLSLLDTYFDLPHLTISSAVLQHHHSLIIHKRNYLPVAFPTGYLDITLSLTLHQDSATHRATHKSLIFSIYHHQNPPVDCNYSTVKGKENH